MSLRAAEFFAGIGLVRAGLDQAGIETIWANDIEPLKRAVYASNFENEHYLLGDIRKVSGSTLPVIDLATASFPCTDLSLAGARKGLIGTESSMLWEFLRVIEEMGDDRPRGLLLENVLGFASSHGGADLRNAIVRLNELGYSCDVLAVDAAHFVAQSRPRLFIVALTDPPASSKTPVNDWCRPERLFRFDTKGLQLHDFDLQPPPTRSSSLADYVARVPRTSQHWWDEERTAKFLMSLSPLQSERVEALRSRRKLTWRTAFRRTRHGVAVWEVRADDIAGCLRTARGGSSKQALVEVGRGSFRVRWVQPAEYASLMGASDLELGAVTPNQALFGLGDAVCVPVIGWLANHYLVPVLAPRMPSAAVA